MIYRKAVLAAAVVLGLMLTTGCDKEPPAVSITYPLDNATISDPVIIRADADDNKEVVEVEFHVDGAMCYSDTESPWEYEWDPTTVSDSSMHTVFAKAYDPSDNVGTSDVVTVFVDYNQPPSAPGNPSPANGATDQPLDVNLSWTGGDPDGDPVTYDVYFGTSSSPSLVASDRTTTNYDPGSLEYNTTYYWKIVAKDDKGATTTGDVWQFTTERGQWLSYDDGSFETGRRCVDYGWLMVRFTRPSGWSAARVTKVRIYIHGQSQYSFDIDAFDDYEQSGGYYWPDGHWITLKDGASQGIGWYEHSVSHTFQSKEFFVGIWDKSTGAPYLGWDEAGCDARSYYDCGGGWFVYYYACWGVRVYVEQPTLVASKAGAPEQTYDNPNKEKVIRGMWLEPSECYLVTPDGEVGEIEIISQ
ncbi:hypothetical protein CEE36_00350 [candidate division TA06 bacterium B3_TA06]|uniref:Fibronectin type-III domain-containing protein n=1 Tax=candidate division TA06 bacterium B3_TA06 TaxID=2012487 RepID=A0A532VAN1_UNCT6|nr:MAG: hypothetical protein CEE36_00350 [candidate division TA06 bacterium B3_TA06]